MVVEGTQDISDLSAFDNASPYVSGVPYYITAAWDEDAVYSVSGVPSPVSVGDGSIFSADFRGVSNRDFPNVPLRADTTYYTFVRYDIENDLGPEVSQLARAVSVI